MRFIFFIAHGSLTAIEPGVILQLRMQILTSVVYRIMRLGSGLPGNPELKFLAVARFRDSLLFRKFFCADLRRFVVKIWPKL
jgi:hypothetical protein